jgi:hypothetical protein
MRTILLAHHLVDIRLVHTRENLRFEVGEGAGQRQEANAKCIPDELVTDWGFLRTREDEVGADLRRLQRPSRRSGVREAVLGSPLLGGHRFSACREREADHPNASSHHGGTKLHQADLACLVYLFPDGTIDVRELVSTEPSEPHLALLEEGNSDGAGRYPLLGSEAAWLMDIEWLADLLLITASAGAP